MPAYAAAFPAGTSVRVVSADQLRRFQADWKFHHPVREEQIAFAGRTAVVKSVGYYHGGDALYELRDVPGTWHEVCLERS